MRGQILCIAKGKPKLAKLLDLIMRVIVNKETGAIEINFCDGGVTNCTFKKREI